MIRLLHKLGFSCLREYAYLILTKPTSIVKINLLGRYTCIYKEKNRYQILPTEKVISSKFIPIGTSFLWRRSISVQYKLLLIRERWRTFLTYNICSIFYSCKFVSYWSKKSRNIRHAHFQLILLICKTLLNMVYKHILLGSCMDYASAFVAKVHSIIFAVAWHGIMTCGLNMQHHMLPNLFLCE